MKRAQLIGISIALVAGILAFVMMRNITNKPQKVVVTEQVNATEVLVARSDIGLGVVANEGHFRWQTWPKDAVSPGFITRSTGGNPTRDFVGAVARSPMMAGERPCPRPWCKSTVMIRAAAARICQAAGMAVGLTAASSLKRARVSRLM